MVNPARLTTIAKLSKRYLDDDGERLYPEATVRGWAAGNVRGFRRRCVVMAGRKTMIDLDAFALWLEDGRGLAAPRPTERVLIDLPGPLIPFDQLWSRALAASSQPSEPSARPGGPG